MSGEQTVDTAELDDLEDAIEAELDAQEAAGEEGAEASGNEHEGREEGSREEEAAPEIEYLTPPDRWNGKFKEAFEQLAKLEGAEGLPEGFSPRDIAQAWLDFHQDRQAYVTPLEQERAHYAQELAQWQEVAGPFQQTWAMSGMTPQQGVRSLLAWGQALQSNPQETIKKLAQVVGVDLGELNQTAEWRDPEISALENRFRSLEGSLAAQQQQAIRAQQEAMNTAIDQQIASVRDALDEHGKPRYPHFADVEQIMAGLYTTAANMVQSGQLPMMPTLEQIYEQAVWSHPEVREKLSKEQEAQEAAQKKGAAERAASASRTVKSKGAGKDNAPTLSLEEEIEQTIDAMGG